jgi:hypothetical protein
LPWSFSEISYADLLILITCGDLPVSFLALGWSNFLAGDGDALATTPCAGIGLGALTACRQALAVALSTEAVDFDKSLHIETFYSSEVTLYLPVFVDFFTDAVDFIFGEVLHTLMLCNAQLFANLCSACWSDAIQVAQSNINFLVSWQVNTRYASHLSSIPFPGHSIGSSTAARLSRLQDIITGSTHRLWCLALALLVLGVFANTGDTALTANYFALFANFLDGSSYFHDCFLLVRKQRGNCFLLVLLWNSLGLQPSIVPLQAP